MKDVVILHDHPGYLNRVAAMKAAHPRVRVVTPDDKPHLHATSVRPPDEWLPADPTMPYKRKCWYKADAMGLAAVRKLGVRADFYWFIESDVVASQTRWKAMFRDFQNDPSDLVAPMIRTRALRPGSRMWQHAPDWATHYILMAVYRLSHAALVECVRCATEMREHFSEVTIPSVIHRAGMSMTGLNVRQTHSNTHTLAAHVERVTVNPELICHPVKRDSFAP